MQGVEDDEAISERLTKVKKYFKGEDCAIFFNRVDYGRRI
jgi:hypothetical protein